jgi:hypothetical protein
MSLAKAEPDLKQLADSTGDWNFQKLQKNMRGLVHDLFATIGADRQLALKATPRSLRTFQGPDKREYLYWRPAFPEQPEPYALAAFALDELFSNLSGVAREAIGQCAECEHFFVRMRATRRGKEERRYCSPSCRWKATSRQKTTQRTLQPAPERAARQGVASP